MPSENSDDPRLRLQDLLSYPREDLHIEIKGWLDLWTKEISGAHKADLAHAILALANHGGGQILIGFKQDGEVFVPDPNRPDDLRGYNQDAMNAIVQHFAEPHFHCHVHFVKHRETNEVYPVIIVPGPHSVPIRSKADGPDRKHVQVNRYYIRRPGPKSEMIQTSQEWDDLIGRCIRMKRETMLDDLRNILYGIDNRPSDTTPNVKAELLEWEGSAKSRFNHLVTTLRNDEAPDRYQNGVWTFAYKIVGDIKPLGKNAFRQTLEKVESRITGWPVWHIFSQQELAPYPHDTVIECWLKDVRDKEPCLSDFWWASPEGMMFLLRAHEDDSERYTSAYRLKAGESFDAFVPIWRVGECLLHALRLSSALSETETKIIVRASWSGLRGRELSSWSSPGRIIFSRRCKANEISSDLEITPEQINSTLAEVVLSILEPLYSSFDFFEMPIETVQQELTKMKRGY